MFFYLQMVFLFMHVLYIKCVHDSSLYQYYQPTIIHNMHMNFKRVLTLFQYTVNTCSQCSKSLHVPATVHVEHILSPQPIVVHC